MHERRADRGEDVEERTREPASDAAGLDQRRSEEHDGGLRKDIAPADVRELVCDRRFELFTPKRLQRSRRDGESRVHRPSPHSEQPWKAVIDEVELRRSNAK